jgi:hypothetical protein
METIELIFIILILVYVSSGIVSYLFSMRFVNTFITILCLPAMPYIIAYKSKEQHPTQAKIIYWVYTVLYLLIIFIIIMNYTH